jgi:hypothetical protein
VIHQRIIFSAGSKFFLIVFAVALSASGLISCAESAPQLEPAGSWSYSFPEGYDYEIDEYYDPEGGFVDAHPIISADIGGEGYLILSFPALSSKSNSRYLIFDTNNPLSPEFVSSIASAQRDRLRFMVNCTAVQGDVLYGGLFGDKGLWMVDISDPANPVDLGVSPIEVTSNLIVTGDIAYGSGQMYDGVSISDVSDPGNVREITRIDLSTRGHWLAVSGEHLFVGIGGTLTVYDVSTSSEPKQVGTLELPLTGNLSTELPPYELDGEEVHWANWAYIIDLQASGDYVYAAFGAGQVRVIDVSDPTAPRQAAEVDLDGFAIALTLEGDYLYVTKSDAETKMLQLCMVDISNPESPVLLDTVVTTSFFGFGGASYAYCFAHPQVIGDYVYVGGVNFFDIFEVKDK